MDKIEYIQGDLVMTKTEPKNFIPNGVICRFELYSDKNRAWIKDVNGIDYFSVERDWIAPVPLTPEILEKNAFEEKRRQKDSISEWYDFYHFDFDINVVCSFTKKEDNFFVCRDSIVLRKIQYVHQLQHLLFGLGLDSSMTI